MKNGEPLAEGLGRARIGHEPHLRPVVVGDALFGIVLGARVLVPNAGQDHQTAAEMDLRHPIAGRDLLRHRKIGQVGESRTEVPAVDSIVDVRHQLSIDQRVDVVLSVEKVWRVTAVIQKARDGKPSLGRRIELAFGESLPEKAVAVTEREGKEPG